MEVHIVQNLLEVSDRTGRARSGIRTEETLSEQIRQRRVRSQLEAMKEGVTDNYLSHHDGKQLQSVVEKEGQELENDISVIG